MGCGKTTVGRRVAQKLGFRFIDTDQEIEFRAGMTILEIFERYGEATFRDMEAKLVQELESVNDAVIATGGGMGANPQHLASLKKHSLVICLWASPEVLYARLSQSKNRPLLQVDDPRGKIEQLLKERLPVYRQADVIMNTGLRSLDELVKQVVHQFLIVRQKNQWLSS